MLVGGYAVSFHGCPRTTGDLDIWIAVDPQNAKNITIVLREFGFNVKGLNEGLFINPKNVIRMGIPPYRIEVLTSIDGVEFDACFTSRIVQEIDGIEVTIISKNDLLINKKSVGRNKDLDDIENLN